MQLDLTEMTQLAPIFRALFRALGFELVCDPRGFYYFVLEQMGAQVNKTAQRLALFTFILVEHLADQGRDPLVVLDGGTLGRHELPALLDKYRDLFLQAEVTTQEELEEKILRRLTQLGFALDSNGTYRFLPPMHRFLDVCLTVQQDRDLAAGLHASDLPLPAPTLASDEDGIDQEGADENDEEAALTRAIVAEGEFDL